MCFLLVLHSGVLEQCQAAQMNFHSTSMISLLPAQYLLIFRKEIHGLCRYNYSDRETLKPDRPKLHSTLWKLHRCWFSGTYPLLSGITNQRETTVAWDKVWINEYQRIISIHIQATPRFLAVMICKGDVWCYMQCDMQCDMPFLCLSVVFLFCSFLLCPGHWWTPLSSDCLVGLANCRDRSTVVTTRWPRPI